MATKSEAVFEAFCSSVGIRFNRVAEDARGGLRTPDYDLLLDGATVVAEVKQLDPSDDDKRKILELKEKGLSGGTYLPGKRVRQEIKDSMDQLRNRAKNRFPAVVVLYNNIDYAIRLIDPYDVLTAMYGLEVARFSVPPIDSGQPVGHVGDFLGPKKSVTADQNTTLSAVITINDLTPEPTLSVFHNWHAAMPLSPSLLDHSRIGHYALSESAPGERHNWIDVTPKAKRSGEQ